MSKIIINFCTIDKLPAGKLKMNYFYNLCKNIKPIKHVETNRRLP